MLSAVALGTVGFAPDTCRARKSSGLLDVVVRELVDNGPRLRRNTTNNHFDSYAASPANCWSTAHQVA